MFEKIFKRSKWETIYFTEDVDAYYRVKGKLMSNNIETKTKNLSGGFSGRDGHSQGGGYSSYEVLVKDEDVFKANEVVHSLR